MKLKYFLLFCLSVYVLSTQYSTATVRYVSKTGSSTPPYTTWQTAADSIQKCINICSFGDTVYVANGVYKEQVVMIPGLSLIGAGMDSCIIDTKDLVSSVGFTAVKVVDSCFFKGFHLVVYYNTSKGYGIAASGNSQITLNKVTSAGVGGYCTSNPIFYKNIFDKVDHGIIVFNSNSIIRNNYIFDDGESSGFDVGIHIEAFTNGYYPIIDSNYVETIGTGITSVFGTRPTISNNIVKLKYAPTGIHLGYSDSASVYNNLIIVDSIGAGEGIHNHATQYLQLYNNYLIGDFYEGFYLGPNNITKNNVITRTRDGVIAWGSENLLYQYNNVWNSETTYSGFIPDTTNLSVDPMIINDDTTRGDLDFYLQMFSPLIDAGDPSVFDKDGSRSDIGMFGGPYGESYKYLDLAPRAPLNFIAVVDTNYITLNWNRNTEADTSVYKVYSDTVINFTIDSTKLISSSSDTFFVQVNPHNVSKYVYKVTCIDKQGNESEPSEEIIVNITSVTIDDYPMTISDYKLYQNYPNPFNPSTIISYRLKERGYVKLYIYDIKGELINVLVNKTQEVGFYQVEFNTTNYTQPTANKLASGVYIYQIHIIGENNITLFTDIKKMIYLK